MDYIFGQIHMLRFVVVIFYYIFGQVRRLMFVGVNFLVKFNFFGHIHSVILNQSSEYSSYSNVCYSKSHYSDPHRNVKYIQWIVKIFTIAPILTWRFFPFQFFNNVMRSAFEELKLKQINRNYYDPAAAIAVPQFNLEIWPGYITTVRQHENNLLLNAEVSNKILR